jgi:hypothetical protein
VLELSVAKALLNIRPEILWKENQLTHTDTLISDVRRDLVELATELGRNEWQSGVASAQVRMSLLDSLFEDVNRHRSRLEGNPGYDIILVRDCKALQRIWNEHRGVIEGGLQTAAEIKLEISSPSTAKEDWKSNVGSASPDFTPMAIETASSLHSYRESLRSYVGLMAQKMSDRHHRIDIEISPSEGSSRARSELQTAFTRLYNDLHPNNSFDGTAVTTIQRAFGKQLGSFLEVATTSGMSVESTADREDGKSLATIESDSVSSAEPPSGLKVVLSDRPKKRKHAGEPSRGTAGRKVIRRRM